MGNHRRERKTETEREQEQESGMRREKRSHKTNKFCTVVAKWQTFPSHSQRSSAFLTRLNMAVLY